MRRNKTGNKEGRQEKMDAMEVLITRRSVRSYLQKEVSQELVDTVLRAAMAAPSAGNEQPWHFVVIRDRQTLDRIMELHPHAAMLRQAPMCICVLGEKALEKHEGMMVQDLSAATQNLMLAARAVGLGTCWCGVHPRPEREEGMTELLGLPEGILCFNVIALGYPSSDQERVDRFQPSRIHQERWRQTI